MCAVCTKGFAPPLKIPRLSFQGPKVGPVPQMCVVCTKAFAPPLFENPGSAPYLLCTISTSTG